MLLSPSSSAVSGVTTKAFVSIAGAGVQGLEADLGQLLAAAARWSRPRPSVASPACSLRNSSIDATYSGAKLMSPDSKAATSRSRKPPSSWYSTS